MYPRILAPTDGSACSERAVQQAVGLASAGGSFIVFLFVMDTLRNYHEGLMTDVRRTLSEEGRAILARAQQIAANARVTADTELIEGDPADMISGRAEDFDLIVMGSHGKGLWKQLTVGSVSQAVVRRTTRPVLLVPCAEAASIE